MLDILLRVYYLIVFYVYSVCIKQFVIDRGLYVSILLLLLNSV